MKPAVRPRKPELSWLNTAFCLLVVFIHVVAPAVASLNKESWQYLSVLLPQRLAFVSVPGFFFLSGLKLFLHDGDQPVPLTTYYRKRGRSVLLPYLIAVTVYYLVFLALHYYPAFSLGELIRFWVVGNVSSHFYFVVALVQFILLYPLWRLVVRRYSAAFLLPFALLLSWISARYFGSWLGLAAGMDFPYNDRVCITYLIYYLAGCCAGRNYPRFLSLLEENRTLIWVLAGGFTLADLIGSAIHFSGTAMVPGLEELHMGYQMSTILFLFWLAARWKDRPLPQPVAAVDNVSYLVYLYHGLAIALFNEWTFGRIPGTLPQLVLRAIFVYLATIGLSLLWRGAFRRRKEEKKGTS